MSKWIDENELTTGQLQEVERQMAQYVQGAEDVIPTEELRMKVIRSVFNQTPLKVKLGLDPSAPDIHLGHTVVLNKIKQFQENGHEIHLIIGDFTGKIGDPTGKSTARIQLTDEVVKQNAKTYFEQFGKLIDMEKVVLHYNSAWLKELSLEGVIELAGKITVARMMERDDFEERLALGKPISLHEFFYPLLQGYDSIFLESDVEIGGTDQYFNILMGRHFQEKFGLEKQVAILMPLLEGLDGVEKMSKSKHNYIGIDESPTGIYGKTMSLPDSLMPKFFLLATGLPKAEIESILEMLTTEKLHPRDAKMMLAKRMVELYHGEHEAIQAEQEFKRVFQGGLLPEQMDERPLPVSTQMTVLEAFMQFDLFASKSEAKRMIAGGGVRIDGEKQMNPDKSITLEDGMVLQVGKRAFIQLSTS